MASGMYGSTTYSNEFQEKLKHYEEEEKRAMSGNDDESYKVELYVYDMSKGIAKQMSPALLGKQIEGIWHTGVVAYGREYFFGSGGIESCRPGGTILGEPDRVEDLGCSQVPYQLFLEYIFGLGESSYKPGAYDLLKHNCNNFSEEVSEFLCGRGIPKTILTLPDEVLNTDLGEILAPLAKSLQLKEKKSVPFGGAENNINSYVPREVPRQIEDPELEELNSAIEEVRHNTLLLENRRNSLNEKLLKKERKERKKEKREKKKKKNRSSVDLGEERGSRRKKRGDSAHTDPNNEEPTEESLTHRRFSEPVDIPIVDTQTSHQPRSPSRRLPPLPPSVQRKSPISPSLNLELPSDRTQTPSPVPSIEVTPTSPVMEEERTEVPPPEEAQPPPSHDPLPVPEDEELPPETPREPPIIFKEEVDVSNRGSFDDAWSSPLSRSLSYVSSSSEDDDSSLSSLSTSSSSSFYSSSSSYSCHTPSLSSSRLSMHESPISAFSNTLTGTSVTNYHSENVSLINFVNQDKVSSQIHVDNHITTNDTHNYRGSCKESSLTNICNTYQSSDSVSSKFHFKAHNLKASPDSLCIQNKCNISKQEELMKLDNYREDKPVSETPKDLPSKVPKLSYSPVSSVSEGTHSLSSTATQPYCNGARPKTCKPSGNSVVVNGKQSQVDEESFHKIRNDDNFNENKDSQIFKNKSNNDFVEAISKPVSCVKNINLKSDYSSDIIPINYNKKKIFDSCNNLPFKMPKELRPSELTLKKSYEPSGETNVLIFDNSDEHDSMKQVDPQTKISVNSNENVVKCESDISSKKVKPLSDIAINVMKRSNLDIPNTPRVTFGVAEKPPKSPVKPSLSPMTNNSDLNSKYSEHFLNFKSSHRPKSKYLQDRLKYQEGLNTFLDKKEKQKSDELATSVTDNNKNYSNVSTVASKAIPLPWYPLPSPTQPSEFHLKTKTNAQVSYESDSDSFYTPDSNISHFEFPLTFSLDTDQNNINAKVSLKENNNNETSDSESYHTPVSLNSSFPFNKHTEFTGNVKKDKSVELPHTVKPKPEYLNSKTIKNVFPDPDNSSFSGVTSCTTFSTESKFPSSHEINASSTSNPTPVSCIISAPDNRKVHFCKEGKSHSTDSNPPPVFEDTTSTSENKSAKLSPTLKFEPKFNSSSPYSKKIRTVSPDFGITPFSGVSSTCTTVSSENKPLPSSSEVKISNTSNPASVSLTSSIHENQQERDLHNVDTRAPPSYEEAVSKKSNMSSSSTESGSVNPSEVDSNLSRSSTQSSVDSSISFGSSYYTLYIVDPVMRPKTPDDTLWSPESSPPPEDLSRSASTCSVDSLRTITPEAEYFEENTRTFRAMRGLSLGSSNESLKTCCSHSGTLSSSTLDEAEDESEENILNQNDETTDLEHSESFYNANEHLSNSFHSEPSTPNVEKRQFPKRTTSLDSIHSVLRRYPGITSPFGSISTLALDSSSQSPSPRTINDEFPDRPPSSDSPILFDSPRGSQESLLLFRPLPRYNTSSVSPEPQSNILCFLGPARPYEPPLTFFQIFNETLADFDGFVHFVADMLSTSEQKHMEELRAYVVEDEGSWALGEDFNSLFARIFHDPSIPWEAQRHLLRIMAAAALKDDVILMLHQDRKEHTIMNFANKIESLPPEIQEALALFFCNMFEHLSPSEWLLYISEWQEGTQQISNIRVTTKIAVNALLHSNPRVQEYGTALMYNLGTKEVKTVVFDDVAPELAMAILQYFNSTPPEEYVWRVITALCRFCYASSEVPALIKMIGPDPNTFKGISERVDNVLEEINGKVNRVRAF